MKKNARALSGTRINFHFPTLTAQHADKTRAFSCKTAALHSAIPRVLTPMEKHKLGLAA